MSYESFYSIWFSITKTYYVNKWMMAFHYRFAMAILGLIASSFVLVFWTNNLEIGGYVLKTANWALIFAGTGSGLLIGIGSIDRIRCYSAASVRWNGYRTQLEQIKIKYSPGEDLSKDEAVIVSEIDKLTWLDTPVSISYWRLVGRYFENKILLSEGRLKRMPFPFGLGLHSEKDWTNASANDR